VILQCVPRVIRKCCEVEDRVPPGAVFIATHLVSHSSCVLVVDPGLRLAPSTSSVGRLTCTLNLNFFLLLYLVLFLLSLWALSWCCTELVIRVLSKITLWRLRIRYTLSIDGAGPLVPFPELGGKI